MILLISSQQPALDSPIDPRFGRSPWLIRVDTETNQWEALANPGANQAGGAGVAAAQFAIDQKADAVISGNLGPNAANAFHAGNLKTYRFSGDISTVQDALEHFKHGRLSVFQ